MARGRKGGRREADPHGAGAEALAGLPTSGCLAQELEGWGRRKEAEREVGGRRRHPSSSSSNDLINKARKEGRAFSEASSLFGGSSKLAKPPP